MTPARKLAGKPWPQCSRRVIGQYSRPWCGVILHLTCGHFVKVNVPMPKETWVHCRRCDPLVAAPARGRA